MSKKEKTDYIPRYITQAPWYESKGLDIDKVPTSSQDGQVIKDKNYLIHQRKNRSEEAKDFSVAEKGIGITDVHKEIKDEQVFKHERDEDSETIKKRKKLLMFNNSKKIKCNNCGSTSHKKSECLEKPRKLAIQYREDSYEPTMISVRDEKSLENSYDAKRDNYYGYDTKDWDKNVERYRLAKKKREQEKTENEDDDDDEDDEEAELIALGLAVESTKSLKQKDTVGGTAVRQLEDRASYLENVTTEEEAEVKGITYNPKTRTIIDPKLGSYNEQNLFVRNLDGEAQDFEKMKKFAWEGNTVAKSEKELQQMLTHHPEASPTAALLAMKKQNEENRLKKLMKKKALLAKYGSD